MTNEYHITINVSGEILADPDLGRALAEAVSRELDALTRPPAPWWRRALRRIGVG